MSDSVRPQRWQPTRLPRPWDSPGKNTGVGCHFLLQCMKVKRESEVAQSCPTLATPWTAAHQAPPSMGFSRQEYWSGVPLPSPTVQYRELYSIPYDGRGYQASNQVHGPQLSSLCSGAREPQLLSLRAPTTEAPALDPVFHNRSHCSEKLGTTARE